MQDLLIWYFASVLCSLYCCLCWW